MLCMLFRSNRKMITSTAAGIACLACLACRQTPPNGSDRGIFPTSWLRRPTFGGGLTGALVSIPRIQSRSPNGETPGRGSPQQYVATRKLLEGDDQPVHQDRRIPTRTGLADGGSGVLAGHHRPAGAIPAAGGGSYGLRRAWGLMTSCFTPQPPPPKAYTYIRLWGLGVLGLGNLHWGSFGGYLGVGGSLRFHRPKAVFSTTPSLRMASNRFSAVLADPNLAVFRGTRHGLVDRCLLGKAGRGGGGAKSHPTLVDFEAPSGTDGGRGTGWRRKGRSDNLVGVAKLMFQLLLGPGRLAALVELPEQDHRLDLAQSQSDQPTRRPEGGVVATLAGDGGRQVRQVGASAVVGLGGHSRAFRTHRTHCTHSL